uniref:UBIQUITIN_CONJUGAT_2 domain-containing protein n=1 Tax=Rhabditophanes sp. KR3021 TaxID=114890 RepID=A0AC35TWA7_9BILA
MSAIDDGQDDQMESAAELGVEASVIDGDYKLPNSYVVKHHIDFEYSLVVRKPIDGMYIIPSATDPFLWFGILVVRCGVYTGGIFRFRFHIPKDFPNTTSVPKIQFELGLFHPNIHQKTSVVNLSRFFPDGFKPFRHRLYHALAFMQKIFFMLDVDVTGAENPEATILWETDKKQFRKVVNGTILHSRAIIYDPPNEKDANAIQFMPWNEEIYGPIRKLVLRPLKDRHTVKEKGPLRNQASLSAMILQQSLGNILSANIIKARTKKGYSWMNTETMRSLSDLAAD